MTAITIAQYNAFSLSIVVEARRGVKALHELVVVESRASGLLPRCYCYCRLDPSP